MKSFLKVNIRQFNAPGEDDLDVYFDESGNFNEEKFDEDFQADLEDQGQDDPPADPPEGDDDPPEGDDPTDNDDPPAGADDDTPEGGQQQPDFDGHKQNQAFADMRRRAEENEKFAEFLNNLAAENGLEDASALMKAYEDRKLEKQAQEQNVPVEQLKENQDLKRRVEEMEQKSMREQVNQDVERTVQKYNLSDDDVSGTIQYMVDNGLFNQDTGAPTIGFEQAYKLANMDNMVAKAKEDAKQEYLESLKQKQDSSTIDSGGGSSIPNSGVPSDEEMLAELKADGYLD